MHPPQERKPRFLLVEDNDAHASLIMRCLADAQMESEVIRIADGESAIDYLERASPWEERDVPDMILLDLRLPRVDGHEILKHIRMTDDLRETAVVILTTSSREKDREHAAEIGIQGYLVKPVGLPEFQRLVRDLSREWWTAALPGGA